MQTVTREVRGHVLIMSLDRPDKLNAFDPQMIRQLSDAYTFLDREPSLRCGVLTANGRYFTSGLDLPKIIAAIPQQLVSPMIPRGAVDPWGVAGRSLRKPVICAVEGPCYTLGIELLLSAQVTVASTKSTYRQAEISRGLFPFGGATVRFPLAVGTNNAYLHLLTADEFSAEEAFRIGLVQKLVAPGQALTEAIRLADRIATNAPLGVRATLESVRRAQALGTNKAISRLRGKFLRLLLSRDARRGVEAFKNRTTAVYEGN